MDIFPYIQIETPSQETTPESLAKNNFQLESHASGRGYGCDLLSGPILLNTPSDIHHEVTLSSSSVGKTFEASLTNLWGLCLPAHAHHASMQANTSPILLGNPRLVGATGMIHLVKSYCASFGDNPPPSFQ